MTRAEGQRMREGQNINSSLSVLGQALFSANGSSCFSTMEPETEHESEMSSDRDQNPGWAGYKRPKGLYYKDLQGF